MGDSPKQRPTLEEERRQFDGCAEEPFARDLPAAAHPRQQAGWEPGPEDSGDADFGEVDYVVALLGAALRKGAFPHLSPRHAQDPSAPLLRIRGFCLMGSVHVKVA